jgi:hypothetical protein
VSSGLLRRVARVRTDVSEEPGASFISSSVLTRTTRRNNPEDTNLHSHRRENLKSYIVRSEVFTAVTMKNGIFWDVNAVWVL